MELLSSNPALFLAPPSVGGLDLDSRSSGCARLGGGVGFVLRLGGIEGVEAELVAPPVQKNAANLNHCARFVLLSHATDETDSSSYLATLISISTERFVRCG